MIKSNKIGIVTIYETSVVILKDLFEQLVYRFGHPYDDKYFKRTEEIKRGKIFNWSKSIRKTGRSNINKDDMMTIRIKFSEFLLGKYYSTLLMVNNTDDTNNNTTKNIGKIIEDIVTKQSKTLVLAIIILNNEKLPTSSSVHLHESRVLERSINPIDKSHANIGKKYYMYQLRYKSPYADMTKMDHLNYATGIYNPIVAGLSLYRRVRYDHQYNTWINSYPELLLPKATLSKNVVNGIQLNHSMRFSLLNSEFIGNGIYLTEEDARNKIPMKNTLRDDISIENIKSRGKLSITSSTIDTRSNLRFVFDACPVVNNRTANKLKEGSREPVNFPCHLGNKEISKSERKLEIDKDTLIQGGSLILSFTSIKKEGDIVEVNSL